LNERLSYNDIRTTEDTIRYTFFASLILAGYIRPHEIILEYPHPGIPNKEVDAYIPSSNERDGLIAEFKYDRNTLTITNSPRTMKAGKVFNDLFRLGEFNIDPRAKKWMIYLTDEEMNGYFSNDKNGLNNFYNLSLNETLKIDKKYICNKAKTFQNAITMNGIRSIEVKVKYSTSLPRKHRLKIFEILNCQLEEE
jgi:hypothetical protein